MEEHDFFSACKEKNASRWNTTFSAYRKTDKKSGSSGSGSYIKNAIMAGADAFLTADLKYHQFYEAENQLL
jgi:putative NIF3 family GTP cyclohydrolase 1 type 2